MSYGVGHRCGWDLALLGLWRKPAATFPFWPLAWEPPYAMALALKRQKKHTFFLFFFCLLRAVPVTYGSSWARGRIGAAAVGLQHSYARSNPHVQSTPQFWQHQILNPLSKARDRTNILKETSQARYHWVTMGTSYIHFYNLSCLKHVNVLSTQ